MVVYTLWEWKEREGCACWRERDKNGAFSHGKGFFSFSSGSVIPPTYSRARGVALESVYLSEHACALKPSPGALAENVSRSSRKRRRARHSSLSLSATITAYSSPGERANSWLLIILPVSGTLSFSCVEALSAVIDVITY